MRGMKAAPFEYTRVESLAEACALLAEHGPDAKLIAGGQSLVPMMAMRLARPARLVDIPAFRDAAFSAIQGDSLPVEANYLSLADNLCDPTHVVYVHRTTLASAGREETRVQHERQGNKVVTWRWVIDGPLIPVFEGLKDFAGNVDRWHYYHYHAPSVAVIDFGSAKTGTGAPEGNRDDCIQMYACHFITPVDQRSCVQHWLLLKNSPANPGIDARLRENLRFAFNEDKRLLEAIQRNEDKPKQWRRIPLGIDGSSIKMRAIVEEMAAADD